MASLLSLITLSLLFHLSSPISDETISNSAEILSNSTFNSMSLTLPLISQSLISSLPSATLFTPSDSSFSLSAAGQPSLSLLQFHFCPRFYSFSDLQSLSYGSKLDTLLPLHPLTITSPVFDDDVSINGVSINSSPLFDDGFFVVYQIDRFFDPNFTSSAPTPHPALPDCPARAPASFRHATDVLRSRGYSFMAAFLDLQLLQDRSNEDERVVTMFAFSDAAAMAEAGQFRNFSEWGSMFLRHVVGCELTWADMAALDDGFQLTTFFKGFAIDVTHSNHLDSAYSLMLNGDVSVDIPDFFRDDHIVIHGISGILGAPNNSDNDVQGAAYSPANHLEF